MPMQNGRCAPGPRGLARNIRNLKRLQTNAHALFLSCQREYGDLVRLPLGPYITHLALHPDHVQHVLVNNHENYRRGKMYENFKMFFGNGILTSDGEIWRKHRRIVQPLFHKAVIEGMFSTFVSCTEAALERLGRYQRSGECFDVVPQMMALTLDALGRAMFSRSLLPAASRIGPAVQVSVRAMIVTGAPEEMAPLWFPIPYTARIRRAQRVLRSVIDDVISHHRDSAEQMHDLVSLLLAYQDEAGNGLAQQQIRDELMTIFMAGHETTGSAMAWTLYNVGKHPEVCLKLEAELSRVLNGRAPTLEDLPKLTYTRMVVEESLRLYPPIWLFPRDAVEDDEIAGYHIPKGSSVFLIPFVTHRHPEFWENPDAFDPERFAPENAARRPRFAYLPFGGGQRLCIGQRMALMQIQIAVAMIAQRFRIHPLPGASLRCATVISLRPVDGIPITLHSIERSGASRAPRSTSPLVAHV